MGRRQSVRRFRRDGNRPSECRRDRGVVVWHLGRKRLSLWAGGLRGVRRGGPRLASSGLQCALLRIRTLHGHKPCGGVGCGGVFVWELGRIGLPICAGNLCGIRREGRYLAFGVAQHPFLRIRGVHGHEPCCGVGSGGLFVWGLGRVGLPTCAGYLRAVRHGGQYVALDVV